MTHQPIQADDQVVLVVSTRSTYRVSVVHAARDMRDALDGTQSGYAGRVEVMHSTDPECLHCGTVECCCEIKPDRILFHAYAGSRREAFDLATEWLGEWLDVDPRLLGGGA